jgi:hypothetical protein
MAGRQVEAQFQDSPQWPRGLDPNMERLAVMWWSDPRLMRECGTQLYGRPLAGATLVLAGQQPSIRANPPKVDPDPKGPIMADV